MKIINLKEDNIKQQLQQEAVAFSEVKYEAPIALSLGFFDGLHLGHQELLRRMLHLANQNGWEKAVWTFDNLPKFESAALNSESPSSTSVSSTLALELTGKAAPGFGSKKLLLSRAAGLNMMAKLGIETVFFQTFTPEVMHMAGAEFFAKLHKALPNLQAIVVGYDFRCGHEMAFGVQELAKWCEQQKIILQIVEPISLNGRAVHSGKIRADLEQGDMVSVKHGLGRPYSLQGRVIHGRALGREIGFPTANIGLNADVLLPPFGVYRSLVKINGRCYLGVSSLGVKPSVSQTAGVADKIKADQDATKAKSQTATSEAAQVITSATAKPLLETYIFDFNADIYGQEIEVFLLKMMRAEQKFANLEALVDRISKDVEAARQPDKNEEAMWHFDTINAIPIYVLPNYSFRSCNAKIIFSLPMAANASAYALALAYVTAVSKEYPTRVSYNRQLGNLYGAAIDSYSNKNGDVLDVILSVSGLSKIKNHRPFNAALEMALNSLNEPLTDANGNFVDEIFQVEKQNAVDELLSQQANKALTAWNSAIKRSFPDSVYALSTLGNSRYLQSLDAKTCQQEFIKMLKMADISVYLHIDPADYDGLALRQQLEKLGRLRAKAYATATTATAATATTATATTRPDTIKHLQPGVFPTPVMATLAGKVTEYKDLEQSRLQMLYRHNLPYTSLQNVGLALLNGIIGGDSSSVIFNEVREEKGLAYEIYSSTLPYRQGLMISAGIHNGSESMAVTTIAAAIKRIQTVGVTATELRRSQESFCSDLRLLKDQPGSNLQFYRNQIRMGLSLYPASMIALAQSFTCDDIQKLACELELATTYILMRKEGGSRDGK